MKITIGLSLLIIALTIAYYFVIYIPQRDTMQRQLVLSQQAQKDQQKTALDACLALAESSYSSNWSHACKSSGMDNTGDTCELPQPMAQAQEQARRDAKDNCFKEYPQN